MLDRSSGPFRRWIRHTASVPKGFLRYYVLKLLKEKPMSGSEIMEEIGKETGGRWKPSPGSVYPLLAWLQDNDYIKATPKKESGIKRYMLTGQGEKFFEGQVKLEKRLQQKLEFFAPPPFLAPPPFFGGFLFSAHPEKLREIRKPVQRFVKALFSLKTALEENFTEQAIKQVAEILNENAERIEKMSRKIKRG
jgi:DNA-binding PadR family transcriptional regulator